MVTCCIIAFLTIIVIVSICVKLRNYCSALKKSNKSLTSSNKILHEQVDLLSKKIYDGWFNLMDAKYHLGQLVIANHYENKLIVNGIKIILTKGDPIFEYDLNSVVEGGCNFKDISESSITEWKDPEKTSEVAENDDDSGERSDNNNDSESSI